MKIPLSEKHMLSPVPTPTALSIFALLAVTSCYTAADGQDAPPHSGIVAAVQQHDQSFWKAYNECQVDEMAVFLTEDIEFYHDKDGLTSSRPKVLESIRSGLCGSGNPRMRREAIEETVEVHLLHGYGAIITGDHRFYQTDAGKPERRAGLATFTHVWQHQDGEWKMSRILSYDHREVEQQDSVTVSAEALRACVGTYATTQMGPIRIAMRGTKLSVKASGFDARIVPMSSTKFHHQERDLEFEFIKNQNGVFQTLIIREHGEVVEKATRATKN